MSVVTSCVGLALSSLIDLSVLGVVCFACTWKRCLCLQAPQILFIGVDAKFWDGSGLFKNCNSFFGTQGAFFGSESFDYTNWIALPDDAASCSSTLVDS